MTKVNLGRVRLNQDMNFIMLNYLDANKKNFLKKIKKALSSRRGEKKDLSLVVKKIIKDVK